MLVDRVGMSRDGAVRIALLALLVGFAAAVQIGHGVGGDALQPNVEVNGAVDPKAPSSLAPPSPDESKAHPQAMWDAPPSWSKYEDPLFEGETDRVWSAMTKLPEALRAALFGTKGKKAPCPCAGQPGCLCRELIEADVKPAAPTPACACANQPQCGCSSAPQPPSLSATCDCMDQPYCPCRVLADLNLPQYVAPEVVQGQASCACQGEADCPCAPTQSGAAPQIANS